MLRGVERHLLAAGQPADALAVFRLWPRGEPLEYLRLGDALIAAGAVPEARELAASVGPGMYMPHAHWASGWIYLLAGDRAEALACFDRIDAPAHVGRSTAEELRAGATPQPTEHMRYTEPPPQIGTWRNTRETELVALLHGLAGDGEHMIDAAIGAFAVDGLRRNPVEWANHTAHLRIGEALAGRAPSVEPALVVMYPRNPTRARLANRLLARLPPLGIEVRPA
jgi:hypothetical protein